MFYQGVILRQSVWQIVLRKRRFRLFRRGGQPAVQRSLLFLPAGRCLFARAHSVAISPAGCLTLFFY